MSDSTAKIVFSLPTNRADKFYGVTDSQVASWSGLYPAVDVVQELRNMLGWLDANPRNRKTTDGIPRFIANWLKKAQNSAPRLNKGNGAEKLPPDYVPASERLRQERSAIAGGPR